MTTYTGWHFLANPKELAHKGGPLPPVGESRSIVGKPAMCRYGFHASESAMDALRYASGPWLERIRLEGTIIVGSDKAVGNRRVSLSAPVNIECELRLWACDEAERVLPIFEAKYPGDERPRRAIEVSRRYAVGQATREELDASEAAAWAAEDVAAAAWGAEAAAWDTARDIAAAAWAARAARAGRAARAAGAAWAVAWAVAWAAAGAAAWAAWDADRDTAWHTSGAAWDAASKRQDAELSKLFWRVIGK